MLDGHDPKLLFEWQAYYQLEPFGEERSDIRNAITCLTISNAFGLKKRGGGQFKLTDFMPVFDQEQESTEYDPVRAQTLMKRLYGNDSKSRG